MTSPISLRASSDSHAFCVAPMIDWTDRYCRVFHRQLTDHARLYTEMIVDQAILNGDRHHLLDFDAAEHPVALQLGGSDPKTLGEAGKIGAEWGYDEINLNVGCPSDRVQSGRFGACLMREPDLVAAAVAAMKNVVSVPVTVKCRIGVDDQDPREVLPTFLEKMFGTGIETVIIHARKAWLQGLSPKENRTVPPLDYPLVRAMQAQWPNKKIILNGGLTNLASAAAEGADMAGVMLGRAAYERPAILWHVDSIYFPDRTLKPRGPLDRVQIVQAVTDHFAGQNVAVWRYARHMLGLFHGCPGAKGWRRRLSQEGRSTAATPDWLVSLTEDMVGLSTRQREGAGHARKAQTS